MAEKSGVSKSQVSREFIEAGERLLKELVERDFSKTRLLVVYIDRLQFGEYHVICAVDVDKQGNKHVLGFREGATETAEVAKALLEDLVARGVSPTPQRLFVIDGAKALRAAIDQVFGTDHPIQRCCNHKKRNVFGHLPKEQHEQARLPMRAALTSRRRTSGVNLVFSSLRVAILGPPQIQPFTKQTSVDFPPTPSNPRDNMRKMCREPSLRAPCGLIFPGFEQGCRLSYKLAVPRTV